jgi:hypothetical protein
VFGAPFYFSLIRKYVILMGTLLNNIRITRTDANGNTVDLLKVPITYAPKDKMLARIMQDPALDRPTATTTLPMISFEMGEIKYDGTRKLNTIGKSTVKSTGADQRNIFKYQYNPVPYNISFKVYIYAKNVEDGTKIIEQILPYFTPDWTTTCNLIPEMEISMDIPIILTNINYDDKYDGQFKDRRTIIWSLDFLLKGYFYGPVKKSAIIKFINLNFYIPPVPDGKLNDAIGNTAIVEKLTIQPGLSANGDPITYTGKPNTETGTVPYAEIEVDDDYGFITQIYTKDELE